MYFSLFMKFGLTWILLFFACILVRLPYLLGEHVYFDGDEAIIGIMAQDLLLGKGFPIYFYGQQYGFSLLEVLASSFFLLFLGNGVYTLKLAGLLIFSLALTFAYRGLLNFRIKPRIALLCVIFLLIFPVWLLWATKVRGGYVTSFVAVSALFYVFSFQKNGWAFILSAAFTIALSVVSHILIILPFLGIVTYMLYQRLALKKQLFFLFATGLFFVLLKWPAYLNEPLWNPSPKMDFSPHLFKNLFTALPSVYTGYSYYDFLFPMPVWIHVCFWLQFVFFLYLLRRRLQIGNSQERTILLLGVLGAFCTFVLAFVVDAKGYRYWLGPFTSYAFLYLYLLFFWIRTGGKEMVKIVSVSVLFGISSFAGLLVPGFWQAPETNDMAALKELNHLLTEHKISGIYCTDPLLTWQLNYYGRGRYSARYLFKKDRTQEFIQSVDKCSVSAECNTAIVGIYGSALGMDLVPEWHNSIRYIGERFYLQPHIRADFLAQAGFELP